MLGMFVYKSEHQPFCGLVRVCLGFEGMIEKERKKESVPRLR